MQKKMFSSKIRLELQDFTSCDPKSVRDRTRDGQMLGTHCENCTVLVENLKVQDAGLKRGIF